MGKLAAIMAVLCASGLWTNSACGLEIQLSPRTLVLSSGGDQLTIHTDFAFTETESVQLDIGSCCAVAIESTWPDLCGNLVVRCSKTTVQEAVGNFNGQFITVDVTLYIEDRGGDVCSDDEELRVKK